MHKPASVIFYHDQVLRTVHVLYFYATGRAVGLFTPASPHTRE